ncbi:hypothetical protein glysoja_007812 [Glycine soja]|nr:hypothetical protein JHK87_034659 [Glycine soja]KHN28080.1 hypothetical protein glysoja_007812 [Glycine soja]
MRYSVKFSVAKKSKKKRVCFSVITCIYITCRLYLHHKMVNNNSEHHVIHYSHLAAAPSP